MTELHDGINRERHAGPTRSPHQDPPHYGEGQTTHSTYGAGDPRIVMTGIEDPLGSPEFHLTHEVTTIGSDPDNDIVLEGILPHHATISHTEMDDYVLDTLGDTETSTAGEESPTDDAPTGVLLRHGAEFRIHGYGFSFQRSEYADHGRPYGGREGGELSRQPQQDAPPDYRERHELAVNDGLHAKLDETLEAQAQRRRNEQPGPAAP
ncbi:FHA domain-containing protein [Gulosibacter molinativorax]|uniref:FHA domain-containing protein n=1 Tax=Gulosibacter molinativorax TaxID=256821 RepID=A0ABT7C9H6_9MICO|nr:FHA domain-containing protein [Gulosibacter molinativorax]MDJ1371296.1 hypothetical protein [Gulosibacter molinativorax]QUY63640.1 Hypotetical protein [Gulosibacter molinativorax]